MIRSATNPRVKTALPGASDPSEQETVPLEDAAFHRYTTQSSAAPLTPTPLPPWMQPTLPEASPWWQLLWR